jgi:DNA-directed RNA polymerase subunit beta'
VEQLFEGAKSKGKEGGVSVAKQLVNRYRRLMHVMKVPADQAFRESMRMIQDRLIENIQKVYLSQGVHLADIHFEVIIRRITSWGKVRLTGDSGLFRHEVMPLHRLEKVTDGVDGEKAVFIPTIVGITAAARDSESFLSAASFQESSRVLARDVLAGKTDFLRGIKERVILGDLIPTGTGFKEHIAYVAKPPKLDTES